MVLEINGITKQFGGIQALSEVTLKINAGEIFGLIGPNGAGKTTMFNIITAMFPPSSGEITFSGQKVTGRKPHEITKQGICRTFQNIRLFPKLTVLENVMIGRHTRMNAGVLASILKTKRQRQEERAVTEKAFELLQLVHLDKDAYSLAGSLAYGQQRRLEIVRALASDPEIILLDEPAAGMNEKETKELFALIQTIRAKGLTVLLIEHDMSLVMRVCDRIAVLNFGEKIAEGTPEQIRNNPKVIEAYLGKEEDK